MHCLEHLKPATKWNSSAKIYVCVAPESGHDTLTALIMAGAHLFFHGLTELKERDDCFKGTETEGNCAKSHPHVRLRCSKTSVN